MMRALPLAFVAFLVPALCAGGQAPSPPAPAPAAPAPATPPPGTPAAPAAPAAKPSPLEPQGYTYEPEGRRDPFVSLVRTGGGNEPGAPAGPRPPGLAGMTASEVSLRGTIKGRDGMWVAILVGVDKKSYLARPGDKLLDGAVRTVTENEMVILQRVNDPLALETQREVRKVLRQTEEAK